MSWGRSLRFGQSLLLAAAACLPLPSFVNGSNASETGPRSTCPGTPITFQGLDGPGAVDVCRAVSDALAFLAANGLDTSAPVELVFVDTLPDLPPQTAAFGSYWRTEQRIYMLHIAACGKLAWDLPVDAPVYAGLVAHEVAHHVAAANFQVARPTRIGHEYIAYVTMFATMDVNARERILGLLPGAAFQSEREIGMTIYLLNPQVFGAKAYRHFVLPGNGAAFIQRILSGHALAIEDPP